MTQNPAFIHEKHKMAEIKELIRQRLQTLERIPRYHGEDLTEQALDDWRQRQRQLLLKAVQEPYFGRLDFREEQKESVDTFYIGKTGVADEETGELMIIDWRAPVASLFYSTTGGSEKVSYTAPEGEITGEIELKRNIVIRHGELDRVVDSYMKGELDGSGTDEFLLYKLEENKDHRLRDIVSTIQAEQNQIIRSPRQQALIIQGVAGSGKTTVALHRIAYLLYHYRQTLQPENMMIFAPNEMFLDYISDVLPELGVGDIQQSTFPRWALERLAEEYRLLNPGAEMEEWHEKHMRSTDAARLQAGSSRLKTPAPLYKGSMAFKEVLDTYSTRLEAAFLPTEQITLWEDITLDQDTLQKWYREEYASYPLLVRRERILERIKRLMEHELKQVERHRQKEIKKTALQNIKRFAAAWLNVSPYEIYQQLFHPAKKTAKFSVVCSVAETLKEIIPREIQKATSTYLVQKRIRVEDLAPLLYLQLKLLRQERGTLLEHAVIDEAQDFSPFQVEVIRQFTRGDSFTILGDLAQGIHAYQGVEDWSAFQTLFEAEKCRYFELRQSYRSTLEIITFANQVIAQANLPVPLAIPVFRSGDPVQLLQVDEAHFPQRLQERIGQLLSRVKTIAIIGRSSAECQRIVAQLKACGIEAQLITYQQQTYSGGISVIPVYLVKGLEFDAVILPHVDAESYRQNAMDAKLLYVACTRALHELMIFYGQQPSPLIGPMI